MENGSEGKEGGGQWSMKDSRPQGEGGRKKRRLTAKGGEGEEEKEERK